MSARRKPAPERRAREALSRRLYRCAQKIDALAAELEQIHGNKAGWYHFRLLPLVPESVLLGAPNRPGVLRQFARIEEEAARGCKVSAEFVAHYRPILERCQVLNSTRPPKRDPNYKPTAQLTQAQLAFLNGPQRTRDEWADSLDEEGPG